ncbi:MAG TPA: hypothetical protein VK072_01105 [Candidatus Avamphibacillus sp.]|nr:hypothetical protein [Candidatus Avamphibacillus sp.]
MNRRKSNEVVQNEKMTRILSLFQVTDFFTLYGWFHLQESAFL